MKYAIQNLDKIAEFRNRLLAKTIHHAFNTVPLYRKLYGNISQIDKFSLDDLDRLPIIDKKIIQTSGEDALSYTVQTRYFQYTSGTTDFPFIIHRSYEESDFINRFFAKLLEEDMSELHSLVLSLSDFIHGTPTSIPGKDFVIPICILDGSTAKFAVQLLLKQYNLSGFSKNVNVISGPLAQVVLFTQYLVENGYEPKKYNIKQICIFGHYLSDHYFRFLKEHWNCVIVNRYSLTEAFGGATEIDKTSFVFDVHIIPQVVNEHGVGLDEGEGRLILTSLFPFVQRQPMIRYDTGDIFTLKKDASGNAKFSFRGRSRRCTDITKVLHSDKKIKGNFDGNIHHKPDECIKKYILCEADILDVLDGVSIIRRTSHAGEIPIKNRQVFGLPFFSLDFNKESNRSQILLNVQCESELPPLLLREASEHIRESMLNKSKTLADEVNTGNINFRVEMTFNNKH